MEAGSRPGLLKDPPPGWTPAVFHDLEEWQGVKNVLFVRLDTIGDVLMTTPAMRAFKERAATTTITLLTSPAGASVARHIPEIDDVVVYEAPWMKASPFRPEGSVDRAVIAQLADRGFGGAVIPTVYSQNPLPSALLCYLAEIPLRAAHCHENPYQLLSHWLKDPEPEVLVRHEVQRQLDLAAALGATTTRRGLSFHVTEQGRSQARRLLAEAGVDVEKPWVLVHPGATAPSRRYPAPLFAEALSLLAGRRLVQIVLSGDEADRGLVEDIRGRLSGVRALSVAGSTSLQVLGAVIEAAPLLIANNTGPVHIAAAVGTPVVDLYALTNPQHTPWEVPNRVLYADVPCRICYKSVCPQAHHRCLAGVPPGAVAEAARELLDVHG